MGIVVSAYLSVANVFKSFGSFTALRDVSLDISEGEFVCFLGPSGCGKTTLLRVISGLDFQNKGRIHQAGVDISALPPSSRDFGIVFQSYALFPNLTVERNVGYGLVGRMQAKALNARVGELLALVGLTDQGRKYPAQLSGGQQQRVALARALAVSPGLLLLDEPLSALDARVRVHLRREIKELQRRLAITTIMVTHDQEEGLTMADRIAVLNQGVIEQIGTPLEIYRRPASPFVADFIGKMNFLPVLIEDSRRIRFGEQLLACTDSGLALAAGNKAIACIRPEDVVVRGVTLASPNRLSVRVSEMEFLGSFYRARLAVPQVPDAVFSADLSVNAVRDLGVESGRLIEVSLPEDRIRVFGDDRQS
jgi:iron(III) transport system ATP-binding protein